MKTIDANIKKYLKLYLDKNKSDSKDENRKELIELKKELEQKSQDLIDEKSQKEKVENSENGFYLNMHSPTKRT